MHVGLTEPPARIGTEPEDAATPKQWVRLRTGSLVPPKAKWVGVVILVNFMLPGDSVDVDDVVLRSY